MLFLHPLVLVSVAIISLEGVQSNNNQLQRVYRVITTDNVDCQPACITGSPSSDTPARSFAHCASRCTEQGCNTFNVLTDGDVEQNRGTVAKVGCQLFDEEADSANIAITLGSQGVWLDTPPFTGHIPGFSATAVDTVGAGDTFIGAFVTRLVEGAKPQDAARFGCAAAAISITRRGAQASIPTRAEVEEVFSS